MLFFLLFYTVRMKKILVLGAGKSATALINYLLQHAETHNWFVIVGDLDIDLAARKIGGRDRGKAIFFDVKDEELRNRCVAEADVVASVLPADLHFLVALDCLTHGKHLITPSYISARERGLDEDFKAKGLLFMGEIGLDPGIDHLSIMKTLADIKAQNGQLTAMRSFCGALIAPESDNNPWHYKFTWAPMNVVLAGQGTAQYITEGKPQYVPYNRLFEQIERYTVEDYGSFEGYANRDSLAYIAHYGVEGIPTFMRGTLRRGGYCAAWNALIRLGFTDNTLVIQQADKYTYADLLASFLPSVYKNNAKTIRQNTADFLRLPANDEILDKLAYLGFFEPNEPILLTKGTPAQLLCDLLTRKWQLSVNDKDMIVMLHQFDYTVGHEKRQLISSMVLTGQDEDNTAIAITVGLPMAMLVKLVATGKLQHLNGVHLPLQPEVYEPILNELAEYGIEFKEKLTDFSAN